MLVLRFGAVSSGLSGFWASRGGLCCSEADRSFGKGRAPWGVVLAAFSPEMARGWPLFWRISAALRSVVYRCANQFGREDEAAAYAQLSPQR